VTAKRARLTGVPDGLADAVEASYELGRIELVSRLPVGYSTDVFRIRAGGRALVLRIEEARLGLESVEWEHALVTTLAELLPEVRAPLRTRGGTTFVEHHGRVALLLPYVEGRPARTGDARERAEAARLLGRLHAADASVTFSLRPGHARLRDLPFPAVGTLPPEIPRGRLAEMRDEAIAFVRGLEGRALTTGMVHGDYFSGNVLVDEDGVPAALLDWEEADLDWQAYELACAAWEFTVPADRDELDSARLAEFVATYRGAGGPVPSDEDELLVGFVRVKRILELLRAPTDRRVDWDYQLRNLRAAERLA